MNVSPKNPRPPSSKETRVGQIQINACSEIDSNKVNLPIIKIKVADLTINALIDTGASCCLLQDSIFTRIKGDKRIKNVATSVSIKTISGGNINFHSCKKIPVTFGNKILLQSFFITSRDLTSDYQCIIGYDFLVANKIIIDIDRSIVKSRNTEVKILDKQTTNCLNTIAIKNYATLLRKTRIAAGDTTTIEVKLNDFIPDRREILLEPLDNCNNVLIYNTCTTVTENKIANIIVANLADHDIVMNKSSKIATVHADIEILPKQGSEKEKRKLKRAESLKAEDFQLDHLPPKEKEKLLELLFEFSDVFSKSMDTIGESDLITPRIQLKHEEPIRIRPFKTPNSLKPVLREQLEQLLEGGIIREADSNYAFPLIMVKKKRSNLNEEQTYRLCVDFRRLNEITYPSTYQLPRIDDILHSLEGANFYSSFDLHSSFYQLKLHPDDVKYATFTCDFGEFSYTRFPMGLSNSAPFFQKLADKLLQGLKPINILGYLDDIICASNGFEETLGKLRILFERFRQHNLTLSPKKCQFMKTEIHYLGHMLSKSGIKPAPSNIDTINNFPVPNTMRRLRRFVGMANFFRKFIPNFSSIVAPLTDLTKKTNDKFKWNSEADRAFQIIKDKLLSNPVLMYPDFDEEFYLFTDASLVSIAGVLMQLDKNDSLHPISYFSRKLKQNEVKWPIMQLECYAIVESIKHFKNYLYGKQFVILSDNKPLQEFVKLDHPGERIARWMLQLSEYDFSFRHIQGKYNVVADFFSRDIHQVNTLLTVLPQVEELIEEQRNDNYLKGIIDVLDKKSFRTKRVKEGYFLENKILKYVSGSVRDDDELREKIVVPDKFKAHILTVCHAPHFGVQKTYETVSENYFWINLYADVKNFVKSCPDCLEQKGFRQTQAPLMRQHIAQKPIDAISIDIVGPLKISNKGNRYILTIVCQFSRFLQLYPLRDMTAESVSEKLLIFMSNFGIPGSILTDQGACFESKLFQELARGLQINKIRSSPYRPETNGINERSHFMLKNTLSCLGKNTSDWDTQLPFYQLAYNNSVHSATKHKPSYLLFGQNITMPHQIIENSSVIEFATVDSFVSNKLDKLKKAFINVRSNLEKAAEKQEKYRNKHAILKDIKVGDDVYLFTPKIDPKLGKAFTRKYTGPFQVVKKLSPVNFKILDINNAKRKPMLVHMDRIFKFTKRKDNLILPTEEYQEHIGNNNQRLPQFESDDENEEYIPQYFYNLHREQILER